MRTGSNVYFCLCFSPSLRNFLLLLSSFQRRSHKERDITTRLSAGLAGACQLKHEGLAEIKELFTRAAWECDLKKSVTAVSRGTGDVLASYSTTRYWVASRE